METTNIFSKVQTDEDKKKEKLKDNTYRWVYGFNSYPISMIYTLMKADMEAWEDVTLSRVYDRVTLWNVPEVDIDGNEYMGAETSGEILKITEDWTIVVKLDDGVVVEVEDELDTDGHGDLPVHGVMWSFTDSLDIDWVESGNGVKALCACGFKVFRHPEWGYFFGLDSGGYDFYKCHWIPLYEERLKY